MIRMGRRLLVVLALVAVGCKPPENVGSASQPAPPAATSPAASIPTNPAAGGEITLPDGLKYEDLRVGDGALAESRKEVAVHYTGWLTDGTKFDSSLDRGTPYTLQLDVAAVIAGWHEGIKGMRVGGKRKLTIPPALGYGSRGNPPVIPGDATLIFEIELLAVR